MRGGLGLAMAAIAAAFAVASCKAVLGIDDPPPIGATDAGNDADASSDAGAYANEVLLDSPILYYRLGEASGPPVDLGSARVIGSYGTLVQRAVTGLIANDDDRAAFFPAADSGAAGLVLVAETPKLEPVNEITVECWITAASYGSTRIVSYGGEAVEQAYQAWVLQVFGGNLSFYSGKVKVVGTTSSAFATGATTLSPGLHHIAGSYDGTTMRVYLDGVPDTIDGGLRATGDLGNYDTTHGLGIGGGFVRGGELQGTIDEVAVYGRALAAERIQTHYAVGVGRTSK